MTGPLPETGYGGGSRNRVNKSKKKQECCRTVVRHHICNDNFITVKIGIKVVRALVDTGS